MFILGTNHGTMTRSLLHLGLSYAPLVPKQTSQISLFMLTSYWAAQTICSHLLAICSRKCEKQAHKTRAVFSPSVQGHLVCCIPDSCLFRTLLKRLWVMEGNGLVYRGGFLESCVAQTAQWLRTCVRDFGVERWGWGEGGVCRWSYGAVYVRGVGGGSSYIGQLSCHTWNSVCSLAHHTCPDGGDGVTQTGRDVGRQSFRKLRRRERSKSARRQGASFTLCSSSLFGVLSVNRHFCPSLSPLCSSVFHSLLWASVGLWCSYYGIQLQ